MNLSLFLVKRWKVVNIKLNKPWLCNMLTRSQRKKLNISSLDDLNQFRFNDNDESKDESDIPMPTKKGKKRAKLGKSITEPAKKRRKIGKRKKKIEIRYDDDDLMNESSMKYVI